MSSQTCQSVYQEMNDLLAQLQEERTSNTSTSDDSNNLQTTLMKKKTFLRNFSRTIHMGPTPQAYTVTTPLFPLDALKVYSAYNLGDEILQKDRETYFSAHRGGSQGDYREKMKEKIENVVDCLFKFPMSKRAVITIPNTSLPVHSCDADAKCMREIHFYLDGCSKPDDGGNDSNDGTYYMLNATVMMRAQAAEIFPKNIHFVGALMFRIADKLNDRMRLSTSNDEAEIGTATSVQVGDLYYLATTLVSVRED